MQSPDSLEPTSLSSGSGGPRPGGPSAGSSPAPPSPAPPEPPGPTGPAASPEPSEPPPNDLERFWSDTQAALRQELQPEQFETWFRRAAVAALDETAVRLAVHNGFTREWLEKYYLGDLARAVEAVAGRPLAVEIVVDAELTAPRRDQPSDRTDPASGGPPSREPSRAAPRSATVADRDDFGSGGLLGTSDVVLNPQYRFDTFVVGPCNRFAHAACVGVGESPGRVYNPLFIHGSVGLGKTHLLQSLCHGLLDRDPGTRILYLSCETFVNHFIGALENGDLQKFRGKYRNVDVLVVDDIHLLANKERTQEEFFHTFNTLYNAGKQIVLSSDSPPVDIPTLQERLVSRFKWGLVTEIEPPCYETRMAILVRKSRERGRQIPEEVAQLLAERIDTNIRELEGAVTKLLGYAGLSGRPITPDLARHCLRDFFANHRREPGMEDITRVVIEHFGVKLSELQSKKRSNAIAYPRQVAMVLARRLTRMSLEEIGSYFGGRDHSTVLHAVKKLKRLVEEDARVRELLTELTFRLQGPSTSR